MNRIMISLKCGEMVYLIDEDDLTKDQLSENLSTLFSINSVAILKTNTTSVIIRPSDIASIQVEPYTKETKVYDTTEEKEVTPPPDEPDQTIDIITDVD